MACKRERIVLIAADFQVNQKISSETRINGRERISRLVWSIGGGNATRHSLALGRENGSHMFSMLSAVSHDAGYNGKMSVDTLLTMRRLSDFTSGKYYDNAAFTDFPIEESDLL